MARFEDTTTIHAPIEQVFAFATDIGKLWACFPGVEVRNAVLTPDGVGSRADCRLKTLFLRQRATAEYTEVVPLQRIAARSSTGRVFLFTFTPRDDGDTDLGYAEEWNLGLPVVGRAIENLAARVGAGYIRRFTATFGANVKAGVQEGATAP